MKIRYEFHSYETQFIWFTCGYFQIYFELIDFTQNKFKTNGFVKFKYKLFN